MATDFQLAKSDLGPILEREEVDRFIVQGSSYGTAHAMATAVCFPDRCMALGLCVPYLPTPICREFGFHTDADTILSEFQFQQPWMILPIFSLLSIFQGFLIQAVHAVREAAAAMESNPEFFIPFSKDIKRSFLRGVWGQSFEMFDSSVNQYWQDPRTITTSCVSVWYADDDSCAPPAHGRWLAEMFQSKEGIQTNIRKEKKGLGHFSYWGKDDRESGSQIKVLLDMLQEMIQ